MYQPMMKLDDYPESASSIRNKLRIPTSNELTEIRNALRSHNYATIEHLVDKIAVYSDLPLDIANGLIREGRIFQLSKDFDHFSWTPSEIKKFLQADNAELPSAFIVRSREHFSPYERVAIALAMVRAKKIKPLLRQLDVFFDELGFYEFRLATTSEELYAACPELLAIGHESIDRHRFKNVRRMFGLGIHLPIDHGSALKLLTSLIEDRCYIAAQDWLSCLNEAGIAVDSHTRDLINQEAHEENTRRKHHEFRMPAEKIADLIKEGGKTVSSECALMYANSEILLDVSAMDRAVKYYGEETPFRFRLRLEELQRVIEQDTEKFSLWLREALLLKILNESGAARGRLDEHADISFRDVAVADVEDCGLTRYETSVATQEEIIQFLHEASFRFRDKIFDAGWQRNYGGEGWHLIAIFTELLWKTRHANTQKKMGVIDHLLDLRHNNGRFLESLSFEVLDLKRDQTSLEDFCKQVIESDILLQEFRDRIKHRLALLGDLKKKYKRLQTTHGLPSLEAARRLLQRDG